MSVKQGFVYMVFLPCSLTVPAGNGNGLEYCDCSGLGVAKDYAKGL